MGVSAGSAETTVNNVKSLSYPLPPAPRLAFPLLRVCTAAT